MTARPMPSPPAAPPPTGAIPGVNDAAAIDGKVVGNIVEDNALTTSGTLTVSDVDDGEAHAVAASGTTSWGSYSVNADGNWSYTVDNDAIQSLNSGDTVE